MSSLDGISLPRVVGASSSPAETPISATEAPVATSALGVAGFVPGAGNSSGLLQNFILPKTTLDALGLLKPSNQGDSEILVSQAFLTAERLADENESAEASALRFLATTQSAFQLRISSLEAVNSEARRNIDANNAQLSTIGTQIGEVSQELVGSEDQQQDLNGQIAELENIDPQTDQIAEQVAALRLQLGNVNAQIGHLNETLNTLQDDQNNLISANEQLRGGVGERDVAIAIQKQVIILMSTLLERLVSLSGGINGSVENAQEQAETKTGEVTLEEIFPDLQKIFEIDLEDMGLETVIRETRLNDSEVKEAVTVSFGLVGSFFESLGVFFQSSNLIELDLDSTAFGNNKSQRMQIPV